MRTIEHGVVLVDETLQVAHVSDVASALLGMPAGARQIQEFHADLEALRLCADNALSLEGQMNQLMEHPQNQVRNWLWHFAQPTIHLHISVEPVSTESLQGQVWIVVDYSASHEFWHNSSKLERRMHDLLTEGDVVAFRLGHGRTFEWVSPSMMRMMGYSHTLLRSRKATEFCHPEDLPICIESFDRMRATGEPQGMKFRAIDSGGRIRNFEGRAFLATDGSGAIEVIMSDVSSHIEMERLRKVMVTAASHELKTPLAFMSTGLSMIEDGTVSTSTDEGRGVIRRMYAATLRLGRLAESIVGYHRLELTRAVVTGRPISVSICVTRAALMVPIERGIQITIIDQSPHVKRIFDEDLVEQAVINLVENAVHHSPDCGTIQVIIGSDEKGSTITVRDEGPGIPVSAREQIFEPFVRMSADHRGAGLGLAIVRRVAELHQGSVIVADGDSGRGSTFVLALADLENQR